MQKKILQASGGRSEVQGEGEEEDEDNFEGFELGQWGEWRFVNRDR